MVLPKLLKLTVVFCLLTMAPFVAWAEDGELTLKITEKDPPDALADPIREVLGKTVIELHNADGPVFEIWLRKELPATKKAESGNDALAAIEEITILGALRSSQERYDFRDDPLDPGVYTMRMGIQPQDGNHLGTAPNDFFAILLRADMDQELNGFADHEDMVDVASEDTIAEHPPILNLQPTKSTEGTFPRLEEGDPDFESHLVYIKYPAKVGDETFMLTVGLAYAGVGEL